MLGWQVMASALSYKTQLVLSEDATGQTCSPYISSLAAVESTSPLVYKLQPTVLWIPGHSRLPEQTPLYDGVHAAMHTFSSPYSMLLFPNHQLSVAVVPPTHLSVTHHGPIHAVSWTPSGLGPSCNDTASACTQLPAQPFNFAAAPMDKGTMTSSICLPEHKTSGNRTMKTAVPVFNNLSSGESNLLHGFVFR